MDQRRCQFCGYYYAPPEIERTPSETCDRCYLKIAEKLGTDFIPAAQGPGKDAWKIKAILELLPGVNTPTNYAAVRADDTVKQ